MQSLLSSKGAAVLSGDDGEKSSSVHRQPAKVVVERELYDILGTVVLDSM